MIAVDHEEGTLPQDDPLERLFDRLSAQPDCDDLVEEAKQSSKVSAFFNGGVRNGYNDCARFELWMARRATPPLVPGRLSNLSPFGRGWDTTGGRTDC